MACTCDGYVMREPPGVCAAAWGSRRSENKGIGNIAMESFSVMFNTFPPVGPKEIIAQAVLFGIEDIFEPRFKEDPCSGVQHTLENGILHAGAIVFARLGHLAQASLSPLIHGGNVIADQHHHAIISTGMVDKRRDRRADDAPTAGPGHEAPAPRASFRLKMDG